MAKGQDPRSLAPHDIRRSPHANDNEKNNRELSQRRSLARILGCSIDNYPKSTLSSAPPVGRPLANPPNLTEYKWERLVLLYVQEYAYKLVFGTAPPHMIIHM